MLRFYKENGFPMNLKVESKRISQTVGNGNCKYKHTVTSDKKRITVFYTHEFSSRTQWVDGFWAGYKIGLKI